MRNVILSTLFPFMSRLFFFLLLAIVPLFASGRTEGDSLAMAVMRHLRFENGMATMELVEAELYLKQKVEVRKKNLLVNLFPNMPQFDNDENTYLSEYVYRVEHFYRRLPEVRRVAALSSFGRDNGEMDAVLEFMTPQLSGDRLFNEEYLSPLSAANSGYYICSLDENCRMPGKIKVIAKPRYDNIQLFSSAWFVVGTEDMVLYEAGMQGRNEQFGFTVTFAMDGSASGGFLVDSVALSIDYSFAGNNMLITADGVYGCRRAVPYDGVEHGVKDYCMGYVSQVSHVGGSGLFPDTCRRIPLTHADSLFYRSKGVFAPLKEQAAASQRSATPLAGLLWRVGDGAVSSHRLAWGDSDLRISPLVNPSYLSYSSSKGLSYKIAMNLRTRLPAGCGLEVKPVIGYNFKYGEPYWNVRGVFSFAPMKRAAFTADVGRGSSLYSSEVLDYIKGSSYDSLRFDRLPIVYYRDFHVKAGFRVEPYNGFELLVGANFYRRSLYNSIVPPEYNGLEFERYYRRFAPHLRVTWQPGMCYCVADGRKMNLGSTAPRFAFDVEQGMNGVFGSRGRYTRAEFDVQYRCSVSSASSLYLRSAVGGYFNADDIYFVDYVFLKNELLPLDKEDEMSGVFQLLDREWYCSADRYLSLNAGYESPFLFMQRVLPSVSFIKSEALYVNVLFISHLLPYWECGYGVETPYVNVGVFAGFGRMDFLKFGYKISFSLFDE